MLIDQHLKIMTKAHGCPPVVSVCGEGVGRCAAYRWYTQKTDLMLPQLPLPMITMRFDGHKKIWALSQDFQLSEKFSLPGQVSIIPSGTPTNWKLVSQFDVVGLVFENEKVREKLEILSSKIKVESFSGYCAQSFYEPFVLNVTKQLVRMDQCEKGLSQQFVNMLFASLEMYITDLLEIEETGYCSESGADRQVNYAVTKLTLRLNEKITIKDIADELGISHSYLSRVFKQKVGLPPHEFLLYKRLERAKMLLLNTQLSIERIAEEVGFHSHSHLTRYFSSYMGVPPLKYRKHMLGGG